MLHIKCRIHIVHILLVQFLTQQFNGFSEPLEVDNFPLSQEFDDIVHVRIIRKPEDVVISDPSLLLWFIT